MKTINVPIGESNQSVTVDDNTVVIEPTEYKGVENVKEEILRAILNPIGSKSLYEIAHGKKTAAIVVNDITRPYPGKEMVEVIASELNKAGISDENIKLVVAYGHHRDNTKEELVKMFGQEINDRFTIVHHHATDYDTLVTLGKTSMGVDVQINKDFALSDVKITTGCITPHQLAGFSGGRKSILPGISGMDSLKKHHSFPIRPDKTSLGFYHGNPFHEQALEAARIAKVDFIVNSVDNTHKEVVKCVAGDVDLAHQSGVELCKKVWGATVEQKADIVIASPGGYPRDFDLHQSQKALGCAEVLCKPNGRIILCTEMRDGEGRPGKVLKNAQRVQQVIDDFKEIGYTPEALSKAYMLARALNNFKISVAGSNIDDELLKEMFFEPYKTVQQALDAAIKEVGDNAKIIIVPNASDILPEVKQNG